MMEHDICKVMQMKIFIFILIFTICAAQDIPGIDFNLAKDLKKEIDEFQGTENHSSVPSEISDSQRDNEEDFHMVYPGMEKILRSTGYNRLEIFCYKGEKPTIVTLLKTVELAIRVPKNEFYYYEGTNSSSIREQYKSKSWFSFTPWRQTSFRLNLYNFSCVGVETKETFTVQLKIRYVDIWRVLTLSCGVGLFLTAPILAQNVVFHYMTGISIGVFGSLLVIVFLFSRIIPKKTGAIATLIGGWGLILYAFQYVWVNCLSLLKEYQTVAIGYIVIAGLLSFAIVYRWGPISDARSLKLVQWSLQIVGLSLVFLSSQYKEFTVAIIIVLLSHYNIPDSWKFKLKTLWLRRFPPKRKLLTEEEYLEQTRIETKKALDELRSYCHSPDCNAWKTMSRLNTPQRYDERVIRSSQSSGNVISNRTRSRGRFAEFVEGSFHLTDNEILSYECASYSGDSHKAENDIWTSDEEEEVE